MGWFDVLDSGIGTAIDFAGETILEAGPIARAVPFAGEVISGTQAVYHAGSAVYDGVTGDRDGAINHGTQALWNGVGAIPAVSEVMGVAELAASAAGLGARGTAEAMGHDGSEIPGGLDDLAGSAMVGLANMAFGADDSNWIADGDRPTGTRSGEIGAGTAAIGGVLGGAAGSIFGPLGTIGGAALGGWLGNEAGNWLGNNETLHRAGMNEGPNAPTSGANPGWFARQGQAAHNALGPVGGGAAAGAALGTMFMPGLGTVAGGIAGGLLGAADSAWNIF